MTQYPAIIDLATLDGTDGFRINGAAAYDGSGFSVSGAGDLNGDGFDDLVIGARYATPHGNGSGAAFVVFGSSSGFDGSFDLSGLNGSNGFRLNGATYSQTGWDVSTAGDFNGDGIDDVIVSAPSNTFVLYGKTSGFNDTFETADIHHFGLSLISNDGDFAGESVSEAGDVNGDGIDDIIIGAPFADTNGNYSGTSYVVFGTTEHIHRTVRLAHLDGQNGFKLIGEHTYDDAGTSVSAAGDINGDGYADLLVGAGGNNATAINSGAVYVVYGNPAGFNRVVNLSTIDGSNGFKITGEHEDDYAGVSVSSAGDVNGDGIGDLVVGASTASPNGTYSGAAYVVFGAAGGLAATVALSSLDGINGFKMLGVAAGDRTGISVSGGGDINGDGFDDVIVGAQRADGDDTDAGVTYVVFGAASGFTSPVELSLLDGNNGFAIDGEAAFDFAGRAVSAAGDVNNDGFADLIIGAQNADPNGTNSGASYVVFGSKPGEAVTRVGTDIANTIQGGDFRDTLSGLGGDDMLIGNGGGDRLIGGTGADVFGYRGASDSTGRHFDVVVSADFAEDRFDLSTAVTGVDATVSSGALSRHTFDAGLSVAVDDAHLAANHAVLFTPDSGHLAGTTFLVVDVNGVDGYQGGGDLVVRLSHATHLNQLSVDSFI